MMTGVNMTHVPYRGVGADGERSLGGQVQFAFDGISSSIPHIQSGRLRALGVSTATRITLLPDVPTVGEFLPGYEATGTQASARHAGTPPRSSTAQSEINAGLADPKIKARLADLGNEPLPLSPADYGKLLADETEKWAKVVRATGLKPR